MEEITKQGNSQLELDNNVDKKYSNYKVYMHRNILNGKVYIGITCQEVNKRWGKNGARYLEKHDDGSFAQPHFAQAILHDGWENFEHEVLETGLTLEQANTKEQELIAAYRSSESEYGYNCTPGGNLGNFWQTEESEQVKERFSQLMRDRNMASWQDPEYRRKMEELNIARWKNSEYRNKMKENSKKTIQDNREKITQGLHKAWNDPQWREKRIEQIKEQWNDEQFKNNMIKKNKETYARKSDEIKKEYSDRAKLQWQNEEYKNFMIESARQKNSKQVLCIETGKIYFNSIEAQNDTGIKAEYIRRCARGKVNTVAGLHWQYV